MQAYALVCSLIFAVSAFAAAGVRRRQRERFRLHYQLVPPTHPPPSARARAHTHTHTSTQARTQRGWHARTRYGTIRAHQHGGGRDVCIPGSGGPGCGRTGL